MLQWSRDLSIAETPPRHPRDGPRPMASMEPRSFDRGNHCLRGRRGGGAVLQWSRDLSIAETRCDGRLVVGIPGFNGAAIFRSRKRVRKKITAIASELQWSRDLSIAETQIPRRCQRSPTSFNGAAIFRSRKRQPAEPDRARYRSASMEPRSFDRGNTRTGTAATTANSKLQWSRDLSIAETARSCAVSLAQGCFNGAAIFRSRKQYHSGTSTRGDSASMEPRSFDRGNLVLTEMTNGAAALLQWSRDLSIAET